MNTPNSQKLTSFLKNNKKKFFIITFIFIIIGVIIPKKYVEANVFFRSTFSLGYFFPVCLWLRANWKDKTTSAKKKNVYRFFYIFSMVIVIGNVVVDLFMTLIGYW